MPDSLRSSRPRTTARMQAFASLTHMLRMANVSNPSGLLTKIGYHRRYAPLRTLPPSALCYPIKVCADGLTAPYILPGLNPVQRY